MSFKIRFGETTEKSKMYTFGELGAGDLFRVIIDGDYINMKTDDEDNNSVCLNDGELSNWEADDVVYPVSGRFVEEK